jgi:hypothetical protein
MHRRSSSGSVHFRLCAVVVLLALWHGKAHAGTDGDFFTLRQPGHLGLTVFASGFGSDTYATTGAGFQLEQSVTRYVGLVGRVSAFQVYQGKGYNSPFVTESTGVRTYERFEGGIDLTPGSGLSLVVLGGRDVGNSNAPVIEGDFSSWLFPYSPYPVNLSFSSTHFFENAVTSNQIDVRTVAYGTARWLLLLGGGGAVWGGGTVGKPNGQGGPDVGLFLRELHTSIDLQSGYGSSHLYGLVSVSVSFGWDE